MQAQKNSFFEYKITNSEPGIGSTRRAFKGHFRVDIYAENYPAAYRWHVFVDFYYAENTSPHHMEFSCNADQEDAETAVIRKAKKWAHHQAKIELDALTKAWEESNENW